MKRLFRLLVLCASAFVLSAQAEQTQQTRQAEQSAATSFVVVTHIDLLPDTATTPDSVETGIQLLKNYVVQTAQADGAKSTRLITWAPTNNHFQVIEVWDNRADFEAHIGSAAVIAFRNSLQGLIGSPYEQRIYYFTSASSSPPHGDQTSSPFN